MLFDLLRGVNHDSVTKNNALQLVNFVHHNKYLLAVPCHRVVERYYPVKERLCYF